MLIIKKFIEKIAKVNAKQYRGHRLSMIRLNRPCRLCEETLAYVELRRRC